MEVILTKDFSSIKETLQCRFQTYKQKSAFTLAEVLITLGIIGVVAAMTLPTLVANYRKKVIVTQVKKFYTVMSQATNIAIAENGPMDGWDGFTSAHNGEEMQHWFDKYLKPNLKVLDEWIEIDEDTHSETFFAQLADGGIVAMTNWAASVQDKDETTGVDNNHTVDDYNGLIHVVYLTNKKALKKEERKQCVNVFSFLFYSPLKKQYFFQPYTYQANTQAQYNREFFKNQISSGNGQYCAALMMMDGWEIKDDYPYSYKY